MPQSLWVRNPGEIWLGVSGSVPHEAGPVLGTETGASSALGGSCSALVHAGGAAAGLPRSAPSPLTWWALVAVTVVPTPRASV